MNLELNGKTALVTGANRGTGQVIAQTLQAEGATVIRHANSGGEVSGDIATADGCAAVLQQ